MTSQVLIKRTRVLSMLLEFLNSNYPDDYCVEDFIVDNLVRDILSLPERSLGKEPYVDYLITLK